MTFWQVACAASRSGHHPPWQVMCRFDPTNIDREHAGFVGVELEVKLKSFVAPAKLVRSPLCDATLGAPEMMSNDELADFAYSKMQCGYGKAAIIELQYRDLSLPKIIVTSDAEFEKVTVATESQALPLYFRISLAPTPAHPQENGPNS